MSDSETRERSPSSRRSVSRGDASRSPPPRSAASSRPKGSAGATAVGSSSRGGPRPRTGTAGSSSSSGKKSRASSGKKKRKKKKPIVEDPKFVRDLVGKSASGDIEWVRSFLSSAEYTNKFDFNQGAGEALVAAAAGNHAAVVEAIVAAGANVNLKEGKALQRAAKNAAMESAQSLVRLGADVNASSTFSGYTPLLLAAQVGCARMVRFLLSKGAEVDKPAHAENAAMHNGWTALHFAADGRADADANGNGNGRAEMQAPDASATAEAAQPQSDASAAAAVDSTSSSSSSSIGRFLETAQALLDAGAAVDAVNSNGDTPLSIAAERGNWDVARWLVSAGANIHATRRGLNVVQWAIYRGAHEAVQYLISYGASPLLHTRTLWFPNNCTLKEVIYKQFSEDIYDRIDLAIYRGGKQALERQAKRKLIAAIRWQAAFDALAFDPSAPTQQQQNQLLSMPEHIVQLISSYEM